MQRKGYVTGGAAVLLAALLAGCSGGSGLGDDSDDSKPGGSESTTTAAEPGKYRTLPEACGEVDRGTLDSMLPGIKEIRDEEQRDKAYEGTAKETYDTDRRVGCSWKIESTDATHHLLVDFERVVSYDGGVSDDSRAEEVYGGKLRAAGLSAPSTSASGEAADGDDEEDGGDGESSRTPSEDAEKGDKPQGGNRAADEDKDEDEDEPKGDASGEGSAEGRAKGGKGGADSAGSGDKEGEGGKKDGRSDDSAGAGSGTGATPPADLQPRTLDDLGDEAFLDDALTTSGTATRHRTVTVVFRTSNVIVTIEYDEQPARRTEVPDSKEMQDKAHDLADRLADRFSE